MAGTLLGDRDVLRRSQLAMGVRAQAYTRADEFDGSAGLPSDQQFFANTADVVRRIKPMTKPAGYSNVSEVDEVVFGRDTDGSSVQELLQASGKEHHLSFDDLDLDGSGEVTHEEIIAGLRAKLGHEPSAAMVEQFLSQVGRPRLHLP